MSGDERRNRLCADAARLTEADEMAKLYRDGGNYFCILKYFLLCSGRFLMQRFDPRLISFGDLRSEH